MTDPAPPAPFLPSDLRANPARIDVWLLPLQTTPQIVEELRLTLSDDERKRALRFYAIENQNLFVSGRGLLREILSAYASVEPARLVLETASKGKPHLASHASLHFNLAHSAGRAVYALANDQVGVDIERIKPVQDWRKISKRFFSQREADELMQLDPSAQLAGFFTCWTRKEAFLKATGEGIAAGLNRFYAGANPQTKQGGIEQPGQPRQWYFKDLQAGSEYSAALVTRFSEPTIRQFDFQQTEDCLQFVHQKKPL